MAYDSRMECVYMHNRELSETICYWFSTQKVTILKGHHVTTCSHINDLDEDTAVRTYFFNTRRFISSPNWNPDPTLEKASVQHGVSIYSGQSTYKYNAAIVGTPADTTATIDGASVNVTEVKLKATASGSDLPFSSDGTAANGIDIGLCNIGGLTGDSKSKLYKVVSNTSNAVYIAGHHASNLAEGDIISIDPIVSGFVGAAFWSPRGFDYYSRKKVTHATCHPGRVISPSASNLQQTSVVNSMYGILRFGVMRNDDLIGDEPLALDGDGNITDIFSPHTSEATGEGAGFDTDRPSQNWTRLLGDGALLFPFVLCLTSNLSFELYNVTFFGLYEKSKVSGAGTF